MGTYEIVSALIYTAALTASVVTLIFAIIIAYQITR